MSDHMGSDHRRPDHKPVRRRRALVVAGPAGAVAAAVVAAGLVVASPPAPPEAAAAPATPTTSATAEASPDSSASSESPESSESSEAPTSTAAAAADAQYPRDARGFTGSAARCDQGQQLSAYGRTSRSLVVICADGDGELEYRGVRLSDDAWLSIPAGRTADGSIVATNDGVTYSVSPTMFLVSEGDTVLYRDSWAEFGQPSPEEPAAAESDSQADDSSAATTTVKTTTVTVTTTAGPTSTAGG